MLAEVNRWPMVDRRADMQGTSEPHHMFALKVLGQVCVIMCMHWTCYLAVTLSQACVVCPWHVAWEQTVSVQCLWQIVPGGCGLIVVDYRMRVSAPVA